MASTISPLAGTLVGAQRPRVLHLPEYVSTSGGEAVELAAMAGLEVDPWQRFVIDSALGERPDGRWAAFEVGLVVPRQNGKGGVIEVRELAGLFLLGERLIIHSAHEFSTSLEAFRRLLGLIENCDDLRRRVKRVSRAHGEEGIELLTGQRIRFRTRTKGGGRGLSGDTVILDEAMILPQAAHGALLPTLSARPNPQVLYAGSAVDREIHEHGQVLARVRERALSGVAPSLAYFEWSPDASIEGVAEVVDDREAWAQSNPALGIRISEEHVARERASLDERSFAVERLCVGDWPSPDGREDDDLTVEAWRSCEDRESTMLDPVCLAVDVRPNRGAAAVAAAGRRPDGLGHVEVVEHKSGTGWVVPKIVEVAGRQDVRSITVDARSPARSLVLPLVKALAEAGLDIEVFEVTASDFAAACGAFYDAVTQRTVRHLGSTEMTAAVSGSKQRPVSDAWGWSRKASTADVCPLIAATLALAATQALPPVRSGLSNGFDLANFRISVL